MVMWDRVLRFIIGAILVIIGLFKGGWWWVGVIIGVILIVTSVIGYCYLYALIGKGTKKESSE
jgi:hypothetical protein